MTRTCLLLALLWPAAAGAQDVHTGAAAYGDWRDDAPGVLRRFEAAAMPVPNASPYAANTPRVVARPAGAEPRVPAGFTVAQWAGGLAMPRVIRRAPSGDIFLAESGAGRVLVFRSPAGAAEMGATEADAPSVFAAGLSRPFGIAFWPPADPRFVYVAETGRVLRYPYAAGDLRARGPGQTVIADLPTGGHWTRDLAVAPDGSRIFLSVGSESNAGTEMRRAPRGGIAAWQAAHGVGAAWGEEANRAVVLQFAPAAPKVLPFATGLRNCSGLAIQPATGAPWCVVNERDGLGDDLPPDYATAPHEGGFYGWPWYYIGDHQDPRLAGRRPDLARQVLLPDVLLQPHSAPLGIVFYDATSGPAAFPAAYRGDAFVALHGSWNRGRRTGYKVVRLHLQPGALQGAVEDFLTGFVVSDKEVWGRPVAVVVAADGALLVTEDANGTVWRVAPAR